MHLANRTVLHVDTVIITPMQVERDALLAMFKPAPVRVQSSRQSALRYALVEVNNHKIAIVVLPSMGNPNAAAAATNAIAELHPRYVLVVGIAAGIEGAADYGDVLIPETVYYHNPESSMKPTWSVELHTRTLIKVYSGWCKLTIQRMSGIAG